MVLWLTAPRLDQSHWCVLNCSAMLREPIPGRGKYVFLQKVARYCLILERYSHLCYPRDNPPSDSAATVRSLKKSPALFLRAS